MSRPLYRPSKAEITRAAERRAAWKARRLNFREFVRTTSAVDEAIPCGLIREAIMASTFSADIRRWIDLEAYLTGYGVCQHALPAAHDVWQRYVRHRRAVA